MKLFLRRTIVWLRLGFMVFTHRWITLAPGVYLQVLRGTSDAEIATQVRAYLKTRT